MISLKSLFKSYFEGKKELFEGLAIDKLETETSIYVIGPNFSQMDGVSSLDWAM